MSAGVPAGTRPTVSSECGEITSMVSVPAGATHSPPMNRRSATCMLSSLFVREVRGGGNSSLGRRPDTGQSVLQDRLAVLGGALEPKRVRHSPHPGSERLAEEQRLGE